MKARRGQYERLPGCGRPDEPQRGEEPYRRPTCFTHADDKWTRESSSSSATCGGRRCASRPARPSTRSPPRPRSASRTARPSRARSPPRSSRSRATSPPSTASSISTSWTCRPSAKGSRRRSGRRTRKIQEMLDRLTAEAGMEMDELTELLLSGRGQRHGDGHPPGGPGHRPRAADVLPAGRLLLAPHLRQVRLGGDRARPRPHHAAAGVEGARPGHARAHPQLPRPAPRGLPAHDPPARRARAGAPRLPAGREAHARGAHRQAALRALRRTRWPR